MDDSILIIVFLNQIEFGAPWDVLGDEDVLEAASMGPRKPRTIHG
jgi:hypothetical protein